MDTTDKNTMIPGKMTRSDATTKLFQDYDYIGFAHELAKIGLVVTLTKQEQVKIAIKLKQLCTQVDMTAMDFLNENGTLRDVYGALHALYSVEVDFLNEYKP